MLGLKREHLFNFVGKSVNGCTWVDKMDLRPMGPHLTLPDFRSTSSSKTNPRNPFLDTKTFKKQVSVGFCEKDGCKPNIAGRMAEGWKIVGYYWMWGNVCSKVEYLEEKRYKTKQNLCFERFKVQKQVYHSSCTTKNKEFSIFKISIILHSIPFFVALRLQFRWIGTLIKLSGLKR